MEFRVLGPLEIVSHDGPVRLDARKRRELLAILLLYANERLSPDRLVDELWGGAAPETATNTLQVHVSRLRKLLEAENGEARLLTEPGGYVLHVDPAHIDARRFEQLVEQAQSLTRPDEVADALREALGLWRGPALADLFLESRAAVEVERLNEARLTALEERIDADLACGRHGVLVPELEALVALHPLRERLRFQLMLALYRSGRQADALEVYRRARDVLVEELGIDPSRELQRLEQAILRQDEALDAVAPEPPPPAPMPLVRKTVTVVSARVSSAAPVDPEAEDLSVGEAIDALAEVLRRSGATVDSRGSDELIGVFGVPALHEDDAIRAVRAAAEARAEVSAVAGDAETPLVLRMGIETADVVASGDRVVGGSAPRRAVELRERAAEGEILASPATASLAREAGAFEPRPPFGEALVSVEAEPPARPATDIPFVGRAAELEHLTEAFERAREGSAPVAVAVVGPAGMGKSRVALELQERVRGRARVLFGRCLPYGAGITFAPLAEIVRGVAGSLDASALEPLLAAEPDGHEVATSVSAALAGGDSSRSTEELFRATRKLLEALARSSPLVVVLDDLHWAEPTFIDLVEHVLRSARGPMLVLSLARADELEQRLSRSPAAFGEPIELHPLSADETEALIEVVPGAPPDAPMRSHVVAAAGGNPLFAEQLVAMLREGGDPASVPPSIRTVLAARLDLLPASEQLAVQAAAVTGRELWPGALAELLDETPDEVETLLAALRRRDLIETGESTLAGETAFAFRHLLIREVAYESAPKGARAELHERFASWFERVVGTGVEHDELLGYHLERAALYRRELRRHDPDAERLAAAALERLARAGRRAVALGDVPAGTNLLTRAAALAAEPTRERAELLAELAEAYREHGDFDRVEETLRETLEVARLAGDAATEHFVDVLRMRVRSVVEPGSIGEIVPIVEGAIPIFERQGSHDRLAYSWALLGWAAWLGCRAAISSDHYERALAEARLAGSQVNEERALHFLLGAALFGPAPVPEAIERCEEIRALRPGRLRLVASASRALAQLYAMSGSFDEAFACIERDREIVEDLELRVAGASARDQYGWVRLLAGDVEGAEREWRAGLEAFVEMGEQASASTLAALTAEAVYARGDLDEARRLTEWSAEHAGPDDLHTQLQWRGPQAKVLARRGELERAVALAREAVELGSHTDFLTMQAGASGDLAETLELAGRSDEARTVLSEALELYELKGNVTGAKRVSTAFSERSAAPATLPPSPRRARGVGRRGK